MSKSALLKGVDQFQPIFKVECYHSQQPLLEQEKTREVPLSYGIDIYNNKTSVYFNVAAKKLD